MFIRVNYDGYGDGFLGAPPARFKNGGLPVGEGDAQHLLTILEGPSSYHSYLARAMARHGTTVPKRFLRIVTSVSGQVPKHLQHVFAGGGGGRMVGGTIDRWTRTVYVVPAPGLRAETRLEYAIHECVHLFAHPHAPTRQQCPQPCVGTFQHEFGTGFGEGFTQVITEDIMDTQGISRYYRDRPYHDFAAVMREVIKAFGRDAMARAYFSGDVQSLRTSMDARWGTNWHAVAGATSAGDRTVALTRIKQLEAAYHKRIEDLIRQSPRGDFPTPSRERSLA